MLFFIPIQETQHNMSRLYFKRHGFSSGIFEEMNTTGSETFDTWLADKDWKDELNVNDSGYYDRKMAEFYGREREWVFNISEEWKHTLVDRLATEIDIDVAEKIIGEVGIRKVMKIVNDSGYYDIGGLPELWEDKGIRQVFYHLLDDTLNINDEYYTEITKEEYDEWVAEYIHLHLLHLLENENEEDEDEEDEDEDEHEDVIVPITDAEFEKIGGAVALCA